MTSSRELVRAFMRGASCPRPPLLPLAFYHASRLDGAPAEFLLRNPTRLTRALVDQQRLLGVDGVAVRIDAAILAEPAGVPVSWSPTGPVAHWEKAGGCAWPPDPGRRGPVTALMEVIHRLQNELQKQVPIVAVLPGPLGLSRQAARDPNGKLGETVHFLCGLAEEACRAGAEVIVLEETADAKEAEPIAAAAESICNVVRYYNAFSVLYAPAPPPRSAADALLWPPGTRLNQVPRESRAGIFLPAACFESPQGPAEFLAELGPTSRPLFLTAGDDILVSHPIETHVALFAALRQISWR